MAKKNDTPAQAALATTGGNGNGSTGLAMAEPMELASDWLGEEIGDASFDVTGTEEMNAQDVRLPTFALNTKGKNAETGRAVAPDEFFHTVNETSKPRLRLVVLTLHKSRAWRENDDATKKPVIRCRSWDNVTGTMDTDVERKCKGCPDYEWRTDPETKKRSRRCGDVYNLVTIDRETGEPAMVRVKKAATKRVKEWYQRYFHKKRPVRTKDAQGRERVDFKDLPFFAFETLVEAVMVKGNGFDWAEPVFTLGGRLSGAEILQHADLARSFVKEFAERVERSAHAADAIDGEPDVDVVDTTGAPTNADDFRDDDAGADAAASGNRF